MSRFMATIYDWGMRAVEDACLHAWRRELLSEARGTVLEVGAGTGANLPHYTPDATRLVLSEPDPHMRKKLTERMDDSRVELREDGVESLAFANGSFETVVSTLVLCSVPDLEGALREIRRVLRPRGRLLFLEHVAAEPGSKRHRWQQRIEPLWTRVMDNCHLTRDTGRAIEEAGFRVDRIQRESMRKAMPLVRPSIRGVAIKEES